MLGRCAWNWSGGPGGGPPGWNENSWRLRNTRWNDLYAAHRELESWYWTARPSNIKTRSRLKYAELVYDGMWFSPLRESLAVFVDATQGPVTGEVRLKLYKGNIIPVGRKSKFSLYREDFATFGQEDVYDQSDAKALFICLVCH